RWIETQRGRRQDPRGCRTSAPYQLGETRSLGRGTLAAPAHSPEALCPAIRVVEQSAFQQLSASRTWLKPLSSARPWPRPISGIGYVCEGRNSLWHVAELRLPKREFPTRKASARDLSGALPYHCPFIRFRLFKRISETARLLRSAISSLSDRYFTLTLCPPTWSHAPPVRVPQVW